MVGTTEERGVRRSAPRSREKKRGAVSRRAGGTVRGRRGGERAETRDRDREMERDSRRTAGTDRSHGRSE